MKKEIDLTIHLKVENGKVVELESFTSPYNRTEFVATYDDPVEVKTAISCINEELRQRLLF